MVNHNPDSLTQAPGNGPFADFSGYMNTTAGVTSASGHLYVSDADVGDTHSVSVATKGLAGQFTATIASFDGTHPTLTAADLFVI